jgi:hypothetical protein
MAFNNERSLGESLSVSHAEDRPIDVIALAGWLENIGALDDIEPYRFLKPVFFHAEYLAEAEFASETVLQEGVRLFGVVEDASGQRTAHIGNTIVSRLSA